MLRPNWNRCPNCDHTDELAKQDHLDAERYRRLRAAIRTTGMLSFRDTGNDDDFDAEIDALPEPKGEPLLKWRRL